MEAAQMGWDFWRIDWPNAALLFALALTPCVALLDFGTKAGEQPATEIASEVGSSALALANENERERLHFASE